MRLGVASAAAAERSPSPAKLDARGAGQPGRSWRWARTRTARCPQLFDDCVACAADYLIDRHGGPVWDAEAFARCARRCARSWRRRPRTR